MRNRYRFCRARNAHAAGEEGLIPSKGVRDQVDGVITSLLFGMAFLVFFVGALYA